MTSESNTERSKPKIVISRETTYVTGPLREDGYVDYVAALNQHFSEGVTAENNAAIPLWQAVGPKGVDTRIRKRYFDLLGIAELPENGEYLYTFDEFLPLYRGWKQARGESVDDERKESEAGDELYRTWKGPWSGDELPVVAALLEHNRGPLDNLADGLRRARFYSPSVPLTADSGASISLSPAMGTAAKSRGSCGPGPCCDSAVTTFPARGRT